VSWETKFLSESISEITEDASLNHTNPLPPPLTNHVQGNQEGMDDNATEEQGRNGEVSCEAYHDTLPNFGLSASEDEIDQLQYGLDEDIDPSGSVNQTIPNNQNETPSDVTNGVAIAANTLVHLTNSGEHSEYEEPGLLEQRMVEDENLTSNSTESCKKWKAAPAINDAKERKDDDETEDIDDSSQCNLVQGRSRQLQILPNTGRYELQKRYQLVKRLMVRGVATTYYTRCINALENCACLYIWCSGCKPKVNRRDALMDGCKHDKTSLVRCMDSDFELLTCKNVYNSEQAFEGHVPSRCKGCKNRIVVDLDEEKAAEFLV
jgi:hypothetical protein